MQAFLGTRLAADINLVAQLLMLAGLWVGFYFARTRQGTKHKNMQTTVVLAQLFFIFFVMITSFYNYVVAGRTITGTVAQLMMFHGVLGLVAEGSGIYLVLRMRTELIPQRYRVRNFKLMMRTTLGLWTMIAVVGFGIYYFRYLEPESESGRAPIKQLRQAGNDLVIHADELHRAISRGNLSTAKRHAEHLVLLIEGRTGEHYGDLDKDGSVEDPGDGTGLFVYLEEVEDATTDQRIAELAERVRDLVRKVNTAAVSVIESSDPIPIEALGRDALSVAQRANTEGIIQIDVEAERAGMAAMPLTLAAVPKASDEPQTVTVLIDQFRFMARNVTVGKGWTVVWINNEAPKHTVTSDDDRFNSGGMGKGDTFEFTFSETGTFPYYCRFHGDRGDLGMAGTITVTSTP